MASKMGDDRVKIGWKEQQRSCKTFGSWPASLSQGILWLSLIWLYPFKRADYVGALKTQIPSLFSGNGSHPLLSQGAALGCLTPCITQHLQLMVHVCPSQNDCREWSSWQSLSHRRSQVCSPGREAVWRLPISLCLAGCHVLFVNLSL